MYICICKAITEKQLQEVVKTSSNASEALKKLGVGSECGVCFEDALNKYFPNRRKNNQPKKRQA